jgi:heterodisulfide reductase subunit B
MIPYRELSYEVSARKVAGLLGVRLVDMPDANCCGLPIDPASHEMATILAARDLCIAERMGLDIATLCSGCASMLTKTNKKLRESRQLRSEVNSRLSIIGMELQGRVNVKHIANILVEDVGLEKIRTHIKTPLSKLRVAPYIGCHTYRPSKYMGTKDSSNPSLLNNLVEITGASRVEYVDEFQCCGASEGSIDNRIPLILAREKLRNAKAAGADLMVTVCPTCHQALDGNQPLIERTFQESYGLPVLHYTQLLGLAMGLSPEELDIGDLRVKPKKVLEAILRG